MSGAEAATSWGESRVRDGGATRQAEKSLTFLADPYIFIGFVLCVR